MVQVDLGRKSLLNAVRTGYTEGIKAQADRFHSLFVEPVRLGFSL